MSILKLLIGLCVVFATTMGASAQVCAFDDPACQKRRAEEIRRQRIERILQGESDDPSVPGRQRRLPPTEAGPATPQEARPHNQGSRTRAVPTAPQ